jgi:hypothetical protein
MSFNLVASAKWKCDSPTTTPRVAPSIPPTNAQLPDASFIVSQFDEVSKNFLKGKQNPEKVAELQEMLFKLYLSTGAEFTSSDPKESSEGEKIFLFLIFLKHKFFFTDVLRRVLGDINNSIESMLKTVSPTDTYDFFQQAAVASAIADFTGSIYNFVNSLKGMNGILQNIAFLMDPNNKAIADGFGKLFDGFAKHSINAQGLADYFPIGLGSIPPLFFKIIEASKNLK